MYNDTFPSDYDFNRGEYDSFVVFLKEKDKEEIENILMRYSLYRPEMVEAALYTAVEKGLISYDLKEQLAEYVRINFSRIAEGAKEIRWARNNAFKGYAEGFSDDRIFDILENPSDIVMDVYQAILQVAVDRGQIEQGESDRLNREMRNKGKTYFQRRNEYQNKVAREIFYKAEPITDEQVRVYAEKYWKCPSCGEMVDMDLTVCWKCQCEMPENVEHPAKEEVIRDMKSIPVTYSPGRIAFTMIISGIVVIVLTFLRANMRGYSITDYEHFRYPALLLGAAGIIGGIGFFIFSALKKEDR